MDWNYTFFHVSGHSASPASPTPLTVTFIPTADGELKEIPGLGQVLETRSAQVGLQQFYSFTQRSVWPGTKSVTFDIVSRCFENKSIIVVKEEFA